MAKVPKVLTVELGSVLCDHRGHVNAKHGHVNTKSTVKLAVEGKRVLLSSDIAGQRIVGCDLPSTFDTGGSLLSQPCRKVLSVTAGHATKLTCGAQPVMLDSLKGTTSGMKDKVTPQAGLSGDAKQSKLTAV
jgi:hypothetical protein